MDGHAFGLFLAFLGGIGLPEILIILCIVVLLFGASRIPEVARSLGKGVDEFKKGLRGDGEEKKELPPPTPPKQIEKPQEKDEASV